jgi:hypothetical protein
MVLGPGPVVGDEVAASAGTHAIAFIGSVATGLHVAARAAGKATLLELGGNGPMVVLDDADVAAAAEASLAASFLCAGQSCTAGERFLVHDAVHDDFVAAGRGASRAHRPPGRPVRVRHHDGAAQQRADCREDGSARCRRGRARSTGSSPAAAAPRASRRTSTGSRRCSRTSPRRWRSRARRRSARRAHHAHLERRGGAGDRERVAVRAPERASGREISPRVCASPRRSTPAGSTSTSRRTTGRATSRSAAERERAPGRVASAEAPCSRRSPSRRPWC